jgi:hypothetical protein
MGFSLLKQTWVNVVKLGQGWGSHLYEKTGKPLERAFPFSTVELQMIANN